MQALQELIFLTGAYPLVRAWLANRSTTLVHTLSWSMAAWLAWCGALLLIGRDEADMASYLALCLTVCSAVAVLGARRPIVGAWNFVLLSLLGVLLLPLAENTVLDTPLLDPVRLMFDIAIVLVGTLNYLPTRFGLSALLLGAACFGELASLRGWPDDPEQRSLVMQLDLWLVTAACWTAFVIAKQRRWAKYAEFDQHWLSFRDRFGLLWSQRVREQFNRAATHAGWPVRLRWRGLRKTVKGTVLSAPVQTAIVETLQELLKRFGNPVVGRLS